MMPEICEEQKGKVETMSGSIFHFLFLFCIRLLLEGFCGGDNLGRNIDI